MTPRAPLIHQPSPNAEPRRSEVTDMLVLHYTGMPTGAEALARLTDAEAKVSAHYLVEEDGTVFALVPENQRAWHAGLSSWRGETDINSRSIGIEIVNPGHEFGYRAFPNAQIDAVIRLCLGVLSRHSIAPRNVVGHADIAPTRKQDPGELFPWARLKSYGIGLWPFDGTERADLPPETVLSLLTQYGYDVTAPEAAVAAFQRHFRPDRVDGIVDFETGGRLARLIGAL
ncbi:MAG: N-acetylmuramoyl-L-alanine amidase [Magnetospirillum sp.]|nr:N-acetylmuramoyl-L-alanine amidase [Magnetospirillum sp.]